MATVLPISDQADLTSSTIPDAPPLSDDIPTAPLLLPDGVPTATVFLGGGTSFSVALPQNNQLSDHQMRLAFKNKITEEIRTLSQQSTNLLVDLKNKFDSLGKDRAILEKEMIDLTRNITQTQRQIEYLDAENERLEKRLHKTKKLITASTRKKQYKEYHSKYSEQAKTTQAKIVQNTLDKPTVETELKILEEKHAKCKQEIENIKIKYQEYEKAYQKVLQKQPIFSETTKPKPMVKNTQTQAQTEGVTLEIAKTFLDPTHYEYDQNGDYDPLIFVILKSGLLEHRAIKHSKSVSKITSEEMEELEDNEFISRIQPAMFQANIGLKEMLTDIYKIIEFDIEKAIDARKKQPFNQNSIENCKPTNYMYNADGDIVLEQNSPLAVLKAVYFKDPSMATPKFSSMMKDHLESGKITEKRINEIVSEKLGTPYSIVDAIRNGKVKKAKLEAEKIKKEKEAVKASPRKRKRTDDVGIDQLEKCEERVKRAREDAQKEKKRRKEAEARAKEEERLRQQVEARAKEETLKSQLLSLSGGEGGGRQPPSTGGVRGRFGRK